MDFLRRIDMSELEPGVVILVQTKDERNYKLIKFEDSDGFNIGNILLSEDTDTGETEAEKVVISRLQIGKPMVIVTAPKRSDLGTFDMASSQTAEIVSIEIYR